MRFNGGGDFSSMHYFGAVVGTAGTSVSLNNAYYLKGMKIGYDPSSLHLTDTDGLPLAKALDGTLLKKLNDFVSGGAGAFSDGKHRVSFDHVVEVMKQTGKDLPSLYKETSTGGLAKGFKEATIE